MMVYTLCLPKESTTSVSITALLWMSCPNPDWPISAAGEDGQASPHSLHTASYGIRLEKIFQVSQAFSKFTP